MPRLQPRPDKLAAAKVILCHRHRRSVQNAACLVHTSSIRRTRLALSSSYQVSRVLAVHGTARLRQNAWRSAYSLVNSTRSDEHAGAVRWLNESLIDSATCMNCNQLRRAAVPELHAARAAWARRAAKRALRVAATSAPVRNMRTRAVTKEQKAVFSRVRAIYRDFPFGTRLVWVMSQVSSPPPAFERLVRLGHGFLPAVTHVPWRTLLLAAARTEVSIRKQLSGPDRADDALVVRRAVQAAMGAWAPEPDNLPTDERLLLRRSDDHVITLPDKGRTGMAWSDTRTYMLKLRDALIKTFGEPSHVPPTGLLGLGLGMLHDVHAIRARLGPAFYRSFYNASAFVAVAFVLPKTHKLNQLDPRFDGPTAAQARAESTPPATPMAPLPGSGDVDPAGLLPSDAEIRWTRQDELGMASCSGRGPCSDGATGVVARTEPVSPAMPTVPLSDADMGNSAGVLSPSAEIRRTWRDEPGTSARYNDPADGLTAPSADDDHGDAAAATAATPDRTDGDPSIDDGGLEAAWPGKVRLVISPRACPWFPLSKLLQPLLRRALSCRPSHWMATSVHGTPEFVQTLLARIPGPLLAPPGGDSDGDDWVLAKVDADTMYFRVRRRDALLVILPLLWQMTKKQIAQALGIRDMDRVPDDIVAIVEHSIRSMKQWVAGPVDCNGEYTEVWLDDVSCAIGMPTSEDLAEAWAIACEWAVLDALYGPHHPDAPHDPSAHSGSAADRTASSAATAHGAASGPTAATAAARDVRIRAWIRRMDDVFLCTRRGDVDRLLCSLNRLVPVTDRTSPVPATCRRVHIPWCDVSMDVHVCEHGVACPPPCASLPWLVDKDDAGVPLVGRCVPMLDTHITLNDDGSITRGVYRKACDGPSRAHWETTAPDTMRFMGVASYGTRAAVVCGDDVTLAAERTAVLQRAQADFMEPERVAATFDNAVARSKDKQHRTACLQSGWVFACIRTRELPDPPEVRHLKIYTHSDAAVSLSTGRGSYILTGVSWVNVRPAPAVLPRGAALPPPWCEYGHPSNVWTHKDEVDAAESTRPRVARVSCLWLGQSTADTTKRMLGGTSHCTLAHRMPTIRRILTPPRPRPPQEAQPGVYAVLCECGLIYVGETIQPCILRWRGHRCRGVPSADACLRSSVLAHVSETGHSIKEWKLVVSTPSQVCGEIIESILFNALPPSRRMNAYIAAQSFDDEDDGPRPKYVANVDAGWSTALWRHIHRWWEHVFSSSDDRHDRLSDDDDMDEDWNTMA